jgi:diguanylate cyclase (GGDEF)-like protein
MGALHSFPLDSAINAMLGTIMAGASFTRWQNPSGFLPIVGPVLGALITPITAEGAAIIALNDQNGAPVQLFATRQSPADLLGATSLLSAGSLAPSHGLSPDDFPILAGPWQVPFGPRVVLVFWREKTASPWKKPNHALVLTAAAALTALLTHGAQPPKEATWRNVMDSLTGLPKARKFVADLPRHFARLDREALPGTLIVVNIDGFDQFVAQLGRGVADAMVQQTAALLVGVTRPTDLVARLGNDEFAIWLNGADHFTAAERAEQLRVAGSGTLSTAVQLGSPSVSLSVGIATRQPGSVETPGSLMRRADYALHEAKAIGPGTWRVSHEVVG